MVVRGAELHAADDKDSVAGAVILSKGQPALLVEDKGVVSKTASRGRGLCGSVGG